MRQALSDPGPEVLDDDIGCPEKPVEEVTPRRNFQIDDDAALVPVVCLEVGVWAARSRFVADQRPAGVRRVGTFDLDDVCAPVGERCGGHRALLPDRQVENTDAFESVHVRRRSSGGGVPPRSAVPGRPVPAGRRPIAPLAESHSGLTSISRPPDIFTSAGKPAAG